MTLTYLPNSSDEKLSTLATIADLKASNTDFEWYPTTDVMIQSVIKDVKSAGSYKKAKTMLDIGAGDGRVLEAFRADDDLSIYKLLAVEKSPNHVARWSENITFVGGDFYESQVNSNDIDIMFSNPPYSDFENWTVTLLKNIHATAIYLVLPNRWVKSERIQAAIKSRDLSYKIISTDDFLTADRKARAKVDVVRLVSSSFIERYERRKNLPAAEGKKHDLLFNDKNTEYCFQSYKHKDPMDLWFEEMFPRLAALSGTKTTGSSESEAIKDRTYHIFQQTNTIDDLVMLYQLEADKVLKAYQKINECDVDFFVELKIDLSTIKETLKARMSSLKAQYWQAFIHNYKPITERLTAKYRDKIYTKLIKQAEEISFNATNALIVTQMVIKLANEYSDDQVTDFFYDLSNPKTVSLYKSNEKVFSDQQWRYCQNPSDRPTHYTLDYRIVQHRLFSVSNYWSGNLKNYELVAAVSDICIIARLVGMKVPSFCNGSQFDNGEIKTGERISVNYNESGATKTLFDIKFYKNGNQHLFLDKEFALRLNIYVGKLLGWVYSADEAFDQMKSKDVANKAAFTTMFEETKVNKITIGSNKHFAGLLEAS